MCRVKAHRPAPLVSPGLSRPVTDEQWYAGGPHVLYWPRPGISEGPFPKEIIVAVPFIDDSQLAGLHFQNPAWVFGKSCLVNILRMHVEFVS